MRSSVRSSRTARESLINRTVELWQARLGRDLSREDARQITENVTGFFAVLAEWSRAERPVSVNNTYRSAASAEKEARHGR